MYHRLLNFDKSIEVHCGFRNDFGISKMFEGLAKLHFDLTPVKIANLLDQENFDVVIIIDTEEYLHAVNQSTHKGSVIVEVHNIEEAEKSAKYPDALIGINNRNLKTLKTEINTTYDIYNVISNHSSPLISESGLKTRDELLDIKNRTSISCFLIGESLLKDLENNNIFSLL